jgi:signal transduction histidine kinase
MVVSFAAVFVAVYVRVGNELRGQVDRDLAGDTGEFVQAMRPLAGKPPSDIVAAANTYVDSQPYNGTTKLLFALIQGAAVVSNHPELFGTSPSDHDKSQSQQARENEQRQRLLLPATGYSIREVPDVGKVRLFERPLNLGTVSMVVGAGEPLALVERAQHGVAQSLLLVGLFMFVLALIASYVAGARVSAPLRRMAGVAARVDAGELEPRMETTAARGGEVRVLADAFNHMLDRLSVAFEGQREFVADASHELRTPLTVIRGQLEVLAAQENPPTAEIRRVERLVQAEITRISRLVDDMLLLAQAEQHDFLRPESIDLQSFVSELWDGVSLTADRHFELGNVPSGTLRADPDRLAQALRNLARNAIEHTDSDTGLVRLEVVQEPAGRVRFSVIDDGPGIPADERERVFERFHRTDPARSRQAGGAGLGLAIVRAIAEAHGGQVRASDTLAGDGARLDLVVPGFHAVARPLAAR